MPACANQLELDIVESRHVHIYLYMGQLQDLAFVVNGELRFAIITFHALGNMV